jgi:hypothetical protein
MYYDDRYGKDVFCRRTGRERRVTPNLIPLYREPRSGKDRRRGESRLGAGTLLTIGLALIGLGVLFALLGHFIALAVMTPYLP